MALIKVHEYETRNRVFLEKLVNTSQIVEIRALVIGCGFDKDSISHLHRIGCNSLLFTTGIADAGKPCYGKVVLIAESIDAIEQSAADASESDYGTTVHHKQLFQGIVK